VKAKHFIGVVLGLSLNLFLVGPVALRSALRGTGDFWQFYIGAQLGHARYDFPAVMAKQRALIDDARPSLVPSRLPFYYAVLWPLGQLSYPHARWIWMALMIGCGIAAVWLYPAKDRGSFAVALAFSPLLFSILAGQDVALLCLILVGGFQLWRRGYPFAAGSVLSLLALKFQLFLLLPAAFLLLGEFAVLRGAALGGSGLVLASFAAGGWNWQAAYLRLLRNPLVSRSIDVMPNLHGLLAGHPAMETVLALMVAALTIYAARRRPEDAIPVTLIGSFLVGIHAFPADMVVLVPPLVSLYLTRNSWLALTCLTPVPALFCALGYGGVAASLLAAVEVREGFTSRRPPTSDCEDGLLDWHRRTVAPAGYDRK